MQELIEKIEVDRQDRMTSINTTRADHDCSRLVQEAERVDPMRGLSSLPHQKEGDFAQDGTLDLFSIVTMESRQQSDHRVDGVALHLLHRISKLIDDERDDHLRLIGLPRVSQHRGCDIERCSPLELHLCMTHLLQDRGAELT